MEDVKLGHWIPYSLIKQGDQLLCHWLNTYGEPFTDPFFEETILKCRSVHDRKLFFSSVSDLLSMSEWAKGLNAVNPAAFIFHISRCGSTLVSQLLATSDENIILAEVPFFDDLLRLPYNTPGFDQTAINELLTAAIKYYGQERTATNNPAGNKKKRLFIKTDSWHLFFYKQLRQLYPSAPFVFIYRSPNEVFRSHRKRPGMLAAPNLIEPKVFGFKSEKLVYNGPDLYLSEVLEAYFSQCLDIIETDDNFLLLNYNEGPMPMIEKIADLTHTALSAKDRANMTERSLYDSKKPGELFSEAAVEDIPPCLNKAMELYHKLEEKRPAILFS